MGNICCDSDDRFVHKCSLSGKADVLSEYIPDKNYLRKFLRSLCLISRDEGHRKTYITSSVGIRKADYYQLKNYYYFIHPFSPFRFYWETFMICIYLPLLIGVPIAMAIVPDMAIVIIITFVFQCITITNIFVQLLSGYFDKSTNVVIFAPKQIFKNYFWQFVLDFLASLPISYCLYLANCDVSTCHYGNYLLLLNIYSLCIYSSVIIQKVETNLTISRLIQWSFIYLIIILWISTFLNDENKIGPKQKTGTVLEEHFHLFTVLAALFGLKTIYKTKHMAVIFKHMIVILLSFFMRIVILAHIILLFKVSFASSRKYSTVFRELREFIHYKKLPPTIKNRIFAYYKFKFKRNFYVASDVWRFLPDHYKFELNKHWTAMWFQSDLFRNCSVPVMHLILKHIITDIYLANDVIFKIGTAVNHVCFLKTGTVAFFDENGRELFHVAEGNFFSEAALILTELLTHECTAVAAEPCEIYKLDRSDFREIISTYPEDYQVIMRKYTKRNQRARFSLNEDDVKAYLDLFSKK